MVASCNSNKWKDVSAGLATVSFGIFKATILSANFFPIEAKNEFNVEAIDLGEERVVPRPI